MKATEMSKTGAGCKIQDRGDAMDKSGYSDSKDIWGI